MTRTYDELVAEAVAAPMAGWDFSWLDGRATEERPSWGYARTIARRLRSATAVLDVQTGGGEVLASAVTGTAVGGTAADADATPGQADADGALAPVDGRLPLVVATEGWPPNVAAATARLGPLGVAVVAHDDAPPLPFGDGAFDLVVSRHPVVVHWGEIARVLRPGGTYLGQHVGPGSGFELIEHFLGPQPAEARHPDGETAAATAAGLDVVDVQAQRLRIELHDVGAVVWLLRKLVWWVPGFDVVRYDRELRALHERMADGPFVAHSTRHLIEARKP